jgi:hypothetical protein
LRFCAATSKQIEAAMSEQPKWTSKIKADRAKEAKEIKRKRRARRLRDATRDKALLAAADNRHPATGECEHLGTVLVIDPMEGENLLHIDRGPPIRMTNAEARPRARVISLRDDPIGKMAQLGRLGRDSERAARLMAARKWQHYYALAVGQRGLDMSGDVVDGGKCDDIAEARLTAIKALSRAAQVLGMRNENLIYEVLGAGNSLEEFLAKSGLLDGSPTRRQKTIDAYAEMLRGCLDDLADVFRFRVRGKGPPRPPDRFDALAGVVKSPRLYDLVNRVSHPASLVAAINRAKTAS